MCLGVIVTSLVLCLKIISRRQTSQQASKQTNQPTNKQTQHTHTQQKKNGKQLGHKRVDRRTHIEWKNLKKKTKKNRNEEKKQKRKCVESAVAVTVVDARTNPTPTGVRRNADQRSVYSALCIYRAPLLPLPHPEQNSAFKIRSKIQN